MQGNTITVGLDLPGLRVERQREVGEALEVTVVHEQRERLCPCCDHVTARVHDYRWQWKQDIALRGKRLWLRLKKRRFRCERCGKVFTEPDDACGWRRRSTKRFREHLAREAAHQTVKGVAEKEGVSQALVQREYNQEAHRVIQEREHSRPAPRRLALDEFSVRRGRKFRTAISDLGEREVLEVVQDNRAEPVRAYLEKLSHLGGVESVVMDMHEPYRKVIEELCPLARIVVDKYHAICKVADGLDRVRRRLQKEERRGKRSRLYRARHLLLKGKEKLSEAEEGVLSELFISYPELERAWELKEDFRAWYELPDRLTAARELEAWEKQALTEGPPEFKGLSHMLTFWRYELINYFDHRLTNGFAEGKNNRIKAIMRAGYGYRNMENLRLRILMSNPRSTMAAGPRYHTI